VISNSYKIHSSVVIKKQNIKEVIHDHSPTLISVDSSKNSTKIITNTKVKFITKWITNTLHDTISVPVKLDTPEIVKLYFYKYKYSDTLFNKDTLDRIKVIVNDVVSQNKIIDRSVLFDYQIIHKEVNTVLEKKPRNQLFLGFNVGEGLGLSSALKTKSDKLYDVGYMFNLRGGVFWLSMKLPVRFRLN
jgi:hypothetical protein